jgi:RNA polymerase sigma factor (sigma-70 family)
MEQCLCHGIATPLPAHLAAERSDEALISAIVRGDKRSMQMLYARHNVRVYRFALRLTRDESLAEDVVSEVFLHAWRGAKNFQAKSKVSTWLLAIAQNKARDALQSRRYEYLSDDDAGAIEADAPEAIWSKKLDGLTPRELDVSRAIVRGLGNKAIAKELNVSVHMVRQLVKSINRKLGTSRAARMLKTGEHPDDRNR